MTSDAPRRSNARRIAVEAAILFVAVVMAAWAVLADEVWWNVHWFRHACAVEPSELRRALVLRVCAGVLAVVLAVFVRPRLGRFLSTRSWRALARKALPSVLAALLALAATEGILRWRNEHKPRRIERYLHHMRRQTMRMDVGGRTVTYHLNREGYRGASTDDLPDRSKPTIIISGESVALGFGLEYSETIGARLTQSTGIQTMNMAASGEGTDLSYVRLQKVLPTFEKPIALVMFIVHTWIERNVDDYRYRYTLDGEGRLIPKAPTPEIVRSSPLRALARTLVPYRDDEMIEVTRTLMREIAKLARSVGAYPLFVLTQCGAHCLDPNPWIAQRLVEGLDAASIRVDTRDVLLPNDMHPGPLGAARHAEAIERALRDAKVIP